MSVSDDNNSSSPDDSSEYEPPLDGTSNDASEHADGSQGTEKEQRKFIEQLFEQVIRPQLEGIAEKIADLQEKKRTSYDDVGSNFTPPSEFSMDGGESEISDDEHREMMNNLMSAFGGADGEIDLNNLPFSIDDLEMNIPTDVSELQGEALVFGALDQEGAKAAEHIMGQLQKHTAEGLSVDYVLKEMCDVDIKNIGEQEVGNMKVNFIELGLGDEDTPETLSSDDLQKMFDR